MSATMSITKPKTMNFILLTALEPKKSTYQIDKGNGKSETRHKISMVLPNTDIPPYLTLPAFSCQYTEFSENGDAETFGKNLDDGKMSVSLVAGAPDTVVRQMPTLLEDQTQALDQLKNYHREMLSFAFRNLPVKGPGSCSFAVRARTQAKKEKAEDIEARAEEIYIEKSHRGGIVEKDIEDENGDVTTKDLLIAKRKVTSYEKGVKGRYPPMFHKIDVEGNFHEIEVGDYLNRRTLVQCRVRPQFFTAPSMYGTTLSLDRDIIVLWRPKSRKRQMESKAVPFFVDGEEEAAPKRQRTE